MSSKSLKMHGPARGDPRLWPARHGCAVMRSSMMAFGLPAQLFTGSLWRAARSAILSGAPKAERKAAPNHIINVSYPGLCSIEQHI